MVNTTLNAMPIWVPPSDTADRRLNPSLGVSVAKRGAGFQTPQARVCLGLCDVFDKPALHGARERQLRYGEAVTIWAEDQSGSCKVQAQKDGYCGWVSKRALAEYQPPTHWICAPGSYLLTGPKVQAPERFALPFGALLNIADATATNGFVQSPDGFVPKAHIRRIDAPLDTAAKVAQLFLGTPYLWGGNSAAGIDCSGLIQGALLACGIPCPADSDMQQSLGVSIAADTPLQRHDLLFWKGHVAMMIDKRRLIHANAHHMSVAIEDAASCIKRIAQNGGGDVTARRRLGG